MKKEPTEKKSGGARGRPSQKDARLKDIVMKAASLFYKNGYAKTSTREIAEAAGISKGLLYYYINSKEDFLDLFIETTTESFGVYNQDILDQLPFTSPAVALKRAIKEFITGLDALQDMIIFWYRESGYMSHEQLHTVIEQELGTVIFFEAILKAGRQRGEFTEDDTNLAAYQIHALCINWALKRWYLRDRYSIDDYIKKIQKSALAIAGYKNI
jgi:TetR/AcrR family transcriptional regulator, cholesterol catabolism regulator